MKFFEVDPNGKKMYGPLLYREQKTALHFDQILTI